MLGQLCRTRARPERLLPGQAMHCGTCFAAPPGSTTRRMHAPAGFCCAVQPFPGLGCVGAAQGGMCVWRLLQEAAAVLSRPGGCASPTHSCSSVQSLCVGRGLCALIRPMGLGGHICRILNRQVIQSVWTLPWTSIQGCPVRVARCPAGVYRPAALLHDMCSKWPCPSDMHAVCNWTTMSRCGASRGCPRCGGQRWLACSDMLMEGHSHHQLNSKLVNGSD